MPQFFERKLELPIPIYVWVTSTLTTSTVLKHKPQSLCFVISTHIQKPNYKQKILHLQRCKVSIEAITSYA